MANLENIHSKDQATPRFERFCETAGKVVHEIAGYIKYAAIIAVGFGVADAQAAPKRKPKPAPKPETELILTLSPLDFDGVPIKLDENGQIPLPDKCDTNQCGLEVRCKLPDGNYAPPASSKIDITKHRGKALVLPSCDKDGDMLTVGIPQRQMEPDLAPLPIPPLLPPAEEPAAPALVSASAPAAETAPLNIPPAQAELDSRQREFRSHHFAVIGNGILYFAGDHLLTNGITYGLRLPIVPVGTHARMGVLLEGTYMLADQEISRTHPDFIPRDPAETLNADSVILSVGPYIERHFGNKHGLHCNVNAALTAGILNLNVNEADDLAVSRTDTLQLGGIPEYKTTVPSASLCLGAHVGYGRLFLGGDVCADATIAPLQIRAGDPQTHRLTGISASAGAGFTFPHPGDWNKPVE